MTNTVENGQKRTKLLKHPNTPEIAEAVKNCENDQSSQNGRN